MGENAMAQNIIQKTINEFFVGQQPFNIVVKTSSAIVTLWLVAKVATNYPEIKQAVLKRVFTTLKAIPAVQGQINKQVDKAVHGIRESLAIDSEKYLEIPSHGLPYEEVLEQMKKMKAHDEQKTDTTKLSGTIYLGDERHTLFLNSAYGLFSTANPLHAEVFPSVRKFEAEVIRMTLTLMHGDEHACGAMTSGGTESILMAVKAYREQAREKGIVDPEIIFPVSAHAAFDKACHYFKVKMVKIPLGSDFKVDTKKLRNAINKNTIAIVGSAPGFPHGIIDPIPELSQIAQAHNIGLHVDMCLGGFVLPFAEQLGYELPVFDFRMPGVTSMSADVHKYAFTPKGTSVVMFRNTKLRSYMYFVAEDWQGGIYASPTIAGSRPGGLIAGAWASMVAIGQDGYKKYVDGIMKTSKEMIEGIKSIPELSVVGDPQVMVIAFASSALDVYRVNAGMSKRGWHLSSLQFPPSIHICVTAKHIGKAAEFLNDLRASVHEVRSDSNLYKDSSSAMYGMTASVPDRSIVRDLATKFLDTILEA